jgi:transposase
MMRFYKQQHPYYCGVDLHTRQMFCCLLDQAGEIREHRNLPTREDRFLKFIEPYRDGLVVGVECMFSWYWLADLCEREQIDFILGHALYMKAVHGGKAKNDKIDSEKIARLMRGGTFPIAYVYPQEMRATRDLLRRRMYFKRKRAELLVHVQNTNWQYNLPAFTKKISYKSNRAGVAERFADPSVQTMVALDLDVITQLDEHLQKIELYLEQTAKVDDPLTFHLLQTVVGVGRILALVLLYEIHDIHRFESVGRFISYCRLVKCAHESAGKKKGSGGGKIGNAHLKWAFSEMVCLLLRESPEAQRFVARKEKKHGKGKAMSILAAKLGRAVYWMLKRKEPFNINTFFAS